MPATTIDQIKKANENQWMSIPGVKAVGIGEQDGRPCIRILADRDVSRQIPTQVAGYRILVRKVDEIKALDIRKNDFDKKRQRP